MGFSEGRRPLPDLEMVHARRRPSRGCGRRDVEGSARVVVHPPGDRHDGDEIGRDVHPPTCRCSVEPARVGVAAPGAERPIEPREHVLDFAMHLAQRQARHVAGERHAVGRAHRRSGDRGQIHCIGPQGRHEQERARGQERLHRGHQWARAAAARQASMTPSRHVNRSARLLSRRWSSRAPVAQACRQ